MNILDTLAGSHWGILPDNLEQIRDIVMAHMDDKTVDWAAMSADLGKPQSHSGRTTYEGSRGQIAVIPIEGPIFPKANMMTQHSGATSAEMVMADLKAAQANPKVEHIVTKWSTPGGKVEGSADMAHLIHSMRGKKPLTAQVSGQACSAGLWGATACNDVYVSSTAIMGSLGTVATLSPPPDGNKRQMKVITSEGADNKVLDPHTPEGELKIKAMLNSMHKVFATNVATYRGMSMEQLEEASDKGSVFVGQECVDRGFADGIASLDELINTIDSGTYVMAKHSHQDLPAGAEAQANTSHEENAGAKPPRKNKMTWESFKAMFENPEVATGASDEGAVAAPVAGIGAIAAPSAELVQAEVLKALTPAAGAVARLDVEANAWADKLIEAGTILPAVRASYVGAYTKLGALVLSHPNLEAVTTVISGEADAADKPVDLLAFFTGAINSSPKIEGNAPFVGGLGGKVAAGATVVGTKPTTAEVEAQNDTDMEAMVAEAAGMSVKALRAKRAAEGK